MMSLLSILLLSISGKAIMILCVIFVLLIFIWSHLKSDEVRYEEMYPENFDDSKITRKVIQINNEPSFQNEVTYLSECDVESGSYKLLPNLDKAKCFKNDTSLYKTLEFIKSQYPNATVLIVEF